MAVRTKLADMLVSEGAAAVLSSRGGSDGTFFTSNGAPYAADAKPVLPELEMAPEDLLRLIRLAEASIPVEIELETRTRFQEPNRCNTPLNASTATSGALLLASS